MSLIHNERIKLTAAAVDRASTASFTVGVLVPVVATLVGVPGYNLGWPLLAALSFSWLLAALALLHRKTHARETARVTFLTIYIFALPFLIVAAVSAIYWWTGREVRKHRAP